MPEDRINDLLRTKALIHNAKSGSDISAAIVSYFKKYAVKNFGGQPSVVKTANPLSYDELINILNSQPNVV